MKFILWKEILQVIDQDQDFLGVTDTCEYFEARTSDTRHLPALSLVEGNPNPHLTVHSTLHTRSLLSIIINNRFQSFQIFIVFLRILLQY